MFGKSAEKLSEKLLQQNIITNEQYEICRYGFQQGMTVLLNFITIAVIGCIMHEFLHAMLFMAAFIPLRRYAGGFHAKTPVRCYLYSVGTVIAILLAIKLSMLTHPICVTIYAVAGTVIAVLAPIEDKHKPLDQTERSVYRKRTLIVAAIETAVFILSFALHMNGVLVCLTWAFAAVAALLAAGKCRNMKHETNQ